MLNVNVSVSLKELKIKLVNYGSGVFLNAKKEDYMLFFGSYLTFNI